MAQRFTNPIRFLGDFHDFIRVLYFLRSGLTKYKFAKLLTIDSKAAEARLEGFVRAGFVEKRDDGKYYLAANSILIDGFGLIEVNDDGISVHIDPFSKFVRKARYSSDSIRVIAITPKE